MPEPISPTLTIGHSPDPDDAFMWYPLVDEGNGPRVDTEGYRFNHLLEDIESLNQRSERAELEVTALSIHQYAHVADRYMLTSCGASMGEGYGPMIVAPASMSLADLSKKRLAVPGPRTTAYLVLHLLYRALGIDPPQCIEVPFDQIIPAVAEGRFDAGLIIHEGQLTYSESGLVCLQDLGQWWHSTQRLPLPLGGNAIRRDLGAQCPVICRVLHRSICWALEHRRPCVEYALRFARGMGHELADRFVGMYVNDRTLDMGPVGRGAVERLLTMAAEAELVPPMERFEIVHPGDNAEACT
jgi:1,4-dihydroxy-6-naphthoate synthase